MLLNRCINHGGLIANNMNTATAIETRRNARCLPRARGGSVRAESALRRNQRRMRVPHASCVCPLRHVRQPYLPMSICCQSAAEAGQSGRGSVCRQHALQAAAQRLSVSRRKAAANGSACAYLPGVPAKRFTVSACPRQPPRSPPRHRCRREARSTNAAGAPFS